MIIDIITLFPDMVAGALNHSIVKRAQERGIVTIRVVDLRDFTADRHRTADDMPYGGGGGMILKVDPIARALTSLMSTNRVSTDRVQPEIQVTESQLTESPKIESPKTETQQAESNGTDAESSPQKPNIGVNYHVQSVQGRETSEQIGSFNRPRVVLTDPRGPRFTQTVARQWATEDHLILLCGHYEGVDERVRQHLVTDEISIGDFILTGGELPALLIADALTRLQPDALGDEQAPDKDSFTDDLLEYPHYTRPREFAGWRVPDILLCGHHAEIERWRRWHQLQATRDRRPDLFARLNLSAQDLKLLNSEEPTAPPDTKAAARNRTAPGTEGREHASPEEPRSPHQSESSGSQADAPRLPVTTDRIDSVDVPDTDPININIDTIN